MQKKRLRVIKIIFFIFLILIIGRLGFWQIFMHDHLVAMAEDQRVTQRNIVAPRGSILFSDGSILAASQPSFITFIQPKLIEQQILSKNKVETSLMMGSSDQLNISAVNTVKESYAKKLAEFFWNEDQKVRVTTDSAHLAPEIREKEITKLEKDFQNKLSKNLFWISLGRKVDLEQKNSLDKMGFIGMGFDNTASRFYPEGSSSAHILGFVGSNSNGQDLGYGGLEGFYNGELKGRDGLLTLEKDALGLPILIGKFLSKDAREGKTLVLNIDRTIQHIAEEKLRKGMEKYGAAGASAIVLEPNTGKILAMASLPAFDPGNPTQYAKESYKNPITADSYEPGSTFKVLVMAAGINEKLVEPDTKCDLCTGPLSIAGFSIRTWNNKYSDDTDMTSTIIHSDNTGMVFVGRKLGVDKLYDYIKKFGFGSTTGIDLQDESSPPLREKEEWKEIDLATASFGQGISVTPLQLVTAIAAIANGGKVYRPQIVSEIRDNKETFKIKPNLVESPISEEAAAKVKDMMVRAVDEGESKFAKPKGYKIAGKTGTAQIAVAGHYDPNQTVASFVGFAPADNPKFVMLVRYDRPTSSIYGAETAAPTFFEIAKEMFIYYGIPPTESQ